MNAPRAKFGSIKEIVLTTQVNGMTAKYASRHFRVSSNSIYWAARRMGIQLARDRKGPAKKV